MANKTTLQRLKLDPYFSKTIETNLNVWSHDQNSYEIKFEFYDHQCNKPINLTGADMRILLDHAGSQPKIYPLEVESKVLGLAKFIMPEQIRGCEGKFTAHIYADYPNKTHDFGSFTFYAQLSKIDKSMDGCLDTVYVSEFENALEKFKEIENKIEQNNLITFPEMKSYTHDKGYIDSNLTAHEKSIAELERNKASKTYVEEGLSSKANKTELQYMENNINEKLKDKRNKADKIKRSDMDTSTDSNRLGLQNLSQEVHNAMAGNANVNPDIPDNSITSEKIADGAVKQGNIDKNLRTKKLTIDDFGAVADGGTDNYEAISKAIRELDEIIIPPCPPGKKYLVSKTIVVPSNKTIRGYGDLSFIQLGNSNELSAYKWRDGMQDFFPIFVTAPNSSNVHFKDFRIEGASTKSKEQIHVGLAIYESKKCSIKRVNVSRINYFPSEAPPRPSGQFRRGWNALTIRSEDVEISYSHFEKGAYECFRIGDDCKRINFHHNTVGNGWRTCVQALRGSEDITIADNYIKQDDFDSFDSHAALTFHSSEGGAIKNIRVERNIIEAKVFTDNPNGGTAVSFVDTYHEDYTFKDNIIISNGYGILANCRESLDFIGNKIITNDNCLAINSSGINSVTLERNKLKSNEKSCVTFNNSSKVAMKRGSISNNDFWCVNGQSNGFLFGGNNEISGIVFNNNHVLQASSFATLSKNVKQCLVTNNDLRVTKVVDLGEGNIIKDNIGYIHES